MKLEQVILRENRADQPAASAVPVGTLCYVIDELVTERSNGTSWDDVSDSGGEGSVGPPGPAGPTGPTGATGSTGPTGPTGPAGTPGEMWFAGSGVPAGALAGSIVGDWYLDTATGDVYEKTGTTSWTLRGNIKGPAGTPGTTGSTGSPGTPGEKWFSGSGAPSGATGIIGDWYLDTTSGEVYEKTGASTWTSRGNIKGPTGTTGSTGSPGAPGENWFSGSGVPAGALSGSIVGDWYLDTVTGNVYEKTATTTWTLRANIMGPQGPPAAPTAHHASHEPGGADTLQLTAASRLFGRGSASGAGAMQELTIGAGLVLTGTDLTAPGARNSALVNYTYNTGGEPPVAGQVRLDGAHPYTGVTKLWMRTVSADGQDVYWGLMVISPGSSILLQDKDDHTLYGRFTTTALPIDKGLYVEIPVVWKANGGAILTASQVLLQSTAVTTQIHHTTHEAGGDDAIKLDDLAAPDDNTDLNASTTKHGLLRKLSGTSTEYLNGSGAWATPAGGGGSTDLDYVGDYAAGTYNDGDIVIGSDGIAYLCVKAGVTTPPEPWPGTGIGVAGPPGANGEQWFSGSSIPASGLGNIGDWYLLTTNGSVYEKTDGTTWTLTANIKGPTGSNGVVQPFYLGHTWGLVGDVTALTTLPSIFIPFNGTQSAKLISIRHKIASGTSVGVQVKRNGSNVGSVITVTGTATTTSLGNVTLTANDEITLVLSSPSGTPTHLSATIILEHTPA